MPEYLAPGVYVEETSFRSKSIEGVSTTTTGFIGPTRYGPLDLEPDIVTSLEEFARTYGDGEQLDFGGGPTHNFVWHAARAFFVEGGKRLYVSRVFLAGEDGTDGYGRKTVGGVAIRARYPGAYGNFAVRLTLKAGRNLLGRAALGTTGGASPPGGGGGGARATLPPGAVSENDVVWIRVDSSPPTASPPDSASFARARRDPARNLGWKFVTDESPPAELELSGEPAATTPGEGEGVRVVTLTVEVLDPTGESLGVWPDLPLDPSHRTGGAADSLFDVFADDRDTRTPIVVTAAGLSGVGVFSALLPPGDSPDIAALERGVRNTVTLDGGNDGQRPGPTEYAGKGDPSGADLYRTGLKQLEALEDISIVAAPGSTANYDAFRDEANAIIGLLLAHAENMRYRIAVVDSAPNHSISDMRKVRAKLSSKYGAIYFPWVKIFDPVTRRTITLPPSGFVAGIYARNDINRAVYKAPANEVVNLALGFEMLLSKPQQDVLNPEGINCFRFFEGRGMLLWGARTLSSDPEWKYVSLRRYFAYLERSIDVGTQWAVFEPNGPRLWDNVRRTIADFLLNEWQMGALLGDKPEQAFFVKCDRTTMSQNDLDNGRLVCLIGVAVVKPAEFVIFRIGQKTADSKS